MMSHLVPREGVIWEVLSLIFSPHLKKVLVILHSDLCMAEYLGFSLAKDIATHPLNM